ncbi:plasmid stabilization protein [Brachybacterium huguangmaarense]
MPDAWSAKRERQYEHIVDSLEEQGRSEETAKEIAARTVNKTRAQEGEATEASRTSTEDMSPAERGGRHSHEGPQGRTRDQLYQDAKRHGIRGRSSMSKAELARAVHRAESRD